MVSFPLADWIDRHSGLPHALGASGMRGSLSTTEEILRSPRESAADLPRLREVVARRLRVASDRVFLTHGASEGNALVLFYLAEQLRRIRGSAPRVRVLFPEYPPLREVALSAGFVPSVGSSAELWVRSEPHNPTGHRIGPAHRHALGEGARHWLLDETFREFTEAPSAATEPAPGVWATGTISKVFGADAVRVGWIVGPEEQRVPFEHFHALVTDQIPDESVRAALDLLQRDREILRESRALFEANRTLLERSIPNVGHLSAPVAFDRPGPLNTDAFSDALLNAGVLVSPGRFFGDPRGVRLGLTRRSFPKDLPKYLAARRRASVPSTTRTVRRGAPRRRRAVPKAAARSGRRARAPAARRAP